MIKNIIGTTLNNFKKKVYASYVLLVCIVIVAVAINVTLCLLYNENTHNLFLALNILIDIATAWFAIFYINIYVVPRKKLLSLVNRSAVGEKSVSQVLEISQQTIRVGAFNCFEISCANDRKLYLVDNGKIELVINATYSFTLVENIIVEAECE